MNEEYTKLQYCKKCLNNGQIRDYIITKSGNKVFFKFDFINNGFIDCRIQLEKCDICNSPVIQTTLSRDEWRKIKLISTDPDFVFAMEKLKQDDIIEFNLKLSQMSQLQPQQTTQANPPEQNKPKCPTCGSTNIERISGTKRWVGTGIFGLASSDLGKTMCCNSCGYKW